MTSEPVGLDDPEPRIDTPPAPPVERSIAFSIEELVALSRTGGVPLPMLGPNPLSHVRLAERATVLDIAGRSLRARDVVVGTGDQARVADAVLGLLAIVGTATLRADVVIDGGATFDRRYHCVPYASVEHVVEDGVHRFTPFATEDLLARIARQVVLTRRPDVGAVRLELPYGVLRAARAAAAAGDDAAVAQAFVDAEMDPPRELVAALRSGGPVVGVRLVRRTAPTRIEGGEVVWLDAGDHGLWLLPAVDQPWSVRGEDGGGVAGEESGAADDGLSDLAVEVVPTDADTIAQLLFTHLPEPG